MRWTQVVSGGIDIGETMGYKLLAGGLIKQALDDVADGCLEALLFLLLDMRTESLCEDVPDPPIFGYHEVRKEAAKKWREARLTKSALRCEEHWPSPCMVAPTAPCFTGSVGGCPLRVSRVSERGKRKPVAPLVAEDPSPVRVLIYGSEGWADEVVLGAVLGRFPLDSVVIHADRAGVEQVASKVAGKLGLATELWTPARERFPRADVAFGFVARGEPDARSRALRVRLERSGMPNWMYKGGGKT